MANIPDPVEIECKRMALRLYDLAKSHTGSPVWETGGVALLSVFCRMSTNVAVNAAAIEPCFLALDDDANKITVHAAVAALSFLAASPFHTITIAQAGAIPPLVALLSVGETHQVAASALADLASNDANKITIAEAGAIPPLIALLSCGPHSAAMTAARALSNLVRRNANEKVNKITIAQAGAIPPLVALLSGGLEEAAIHAADTLLSLMSRRAAVGRGGARGSCALLPANRATIAEAGAIPPLVALLSGGSDAALIAARDVLWFLSRFYAADIIDAIAPASDSRDRRLPEQLRTRSGLLALLHSALRDASTAHMQAAEVGTDAEVLERAIERASVVHAEASALTRARARLEELAERQRRRMSFGIDKLPVPDDFVCPITFEKMRDPVVASDGNSYERSAIMLVIEAGGRSPLTREELSSNVFSNRNLKRRIDEHEEEVLCVAETAWAAMAAADKELVLQAPPSRRTRHSTARSEGPAPKRSRS
jgi:vacuolar protein 8